MPGEYFLKKEQYPLHLLIDVTYCATTITVTSLFVSLSVRWKELEPREAGIHESIEPSYCICACSLSGEKRRHLDRLTHS